MPVKVTFNNWVSRTKPIEILMFDSEALAVLIVTILDFGEVMTVNFFFLICEL